MKIFGKKEVTEAIEKNTDTMVATDTTALNGMSYTEFVYQKQESEKKRLNDEIKSLEDSIKEAAAERARDSSNYDVITKHIAKAQDRVQEAEKELKEVDFEHPVDAELSLIAALLDNAGGYNRSIDLLNEAVKKINELNSILEEAERAGKGPYSPAPVLLLRSAVERLIPAINNEYTSGPLAARKKDKRELKKKFDDKFIEIQDKKKYAAAIKDKFKI